MRSVQSIMRSLTAGLQQSRARFCAQRYFSNYSRLLPVPQRNRPRITKGFVSSTREVPANIERPDYSNVDQYDLDEYQSEDKRINSKDLITIWTEEDIAKIRRSNALAKEILTFGGSLIKPGATTDEIDAQIHAAIVASGAYPSPLHYEKYPKAGDIVNLDVTVFKEGFHGDTSATFIVGGSTDKSAWNLVETTRQALEKGIQACAPGVPFKKIGRVIQEIADKNGLSVVPEFAGHGVGRIFHSPPFIFHFRNDEPGVMQPGMVFTIEPVLCEGPPEFEMWNDGWTAQSLCGGWSAQFEHTVLITASGVDVLTR